MNVRRRPLRGASPIGSGPCAAAAEHRPPRPELIWAVVFFLFLYLGMVAIQVAKGTALVLSLVAGFLTFLIVRTRGGDDPRDRA